MKKCKNMFIVPNWNKSTTDLIPLPLDFIVGQGKYTRVQNGFSGKY